MNLFSSFSSRFEVRPHVWPVIVITVGVLLIYLWGLMHPSFGPELAMYYSTERHANFQEILKNYVTFEHGFYRPTAFYVPYYIAKHFLDWQNVAAWKFLHVLSLAGACLSTYALVLVLFPGAIIAGVMAAFYLAIFPGMFSIVFQTSAFDNLYIIAVDVGLILYCLAQRREGAARWKAVSGAVLAHIIGLTCKENALAMPGFLVVISLAVLWEEGSWKTWKRQAAMLLPFVAVTLLYLVLHVSKLPNIGGTGEYRSGWNTEWIVRNLLQYPLWIVRLFGGTGDVKGQAAGLDNPRNTFFALLVFALTVCYWIPQIRTNRAERMKAAMLLAFTACFLVVPVYSGAFLWHVNLAACGYAIVAGVALEYWWRTLAPGSIRTTSAVLFLSWMGYVGVASSQDVVLRGVHAAMYRINTQDVLHERPVAVDKIRDGALIYFEDEQGLGDWAYGGGRLFNYMYLLPHIKQTPVRPGSLTLQQRLVWLKNPNAFYFKHDATRGWYDASHQFRAESVGALPAYTGELIEKKDCLGVTNLLKELLQYEAVRENYLLRYHNGYCLLQMQQPKEAAAEFDESLKRNPKFTYALTHRAHAYQELSQPQKACADFRAAAAIDPALGKTMPPGCR